MAPLKKSATAGKARLLHCARPKPPSIQKTTELIARGSASMISTLLPAAMTKETASPARISRVGPVLCVKPATETTIAVAISAPAKAKIGTVKTPSRLPSIRIARLAPKPAPAETPSRCGSASGFRVTLCIAAPAMPSPAPTIAANNARGRRSSQTILARPSVQSGAIEERDSLCATIRQTVSAGIEVEPMLTESVIATRQSTIPVMQREAKLRRRSTIIARSPAVEEIGQALDGMDVAGPRRQLVIAQHQETIVADSGDMGEGRVLLHEGDLLIGSDLPVFDDHHHLRIAFGDRLPIDADPAALDILRDISSPGGIDDGLRHGVATRAHRHLVA